MTKYMTFGHFKSIFNTKRLDMIDLIIFSGSRNLWRLLGEYEPLDVLLCYYMRLLSGPGRLKIAENDKIYDL